MAVVPEQLPGLQPDLARARELAREANVVPVRYTFVDDCETPVSAFLKLRGEGPSFLLESAEQGRLGRWSFLGFRPRAILRWSDGVLSEWEGGTGAGPPDRTSEVADPYAAVAEYLGRYEIAEPESLPPFAGGAVGFFGYDLVRTVRADPRPAQPGPGRSARPGADDHRPAGRLRPPAARGDRDRQRLRRGRGRAWRRPTTARSRRSRDVRERLRARCRGAEIPPAAPSRSSSPPT